MFNQTFVDGGQRTSKRYTMLFSILLQLLGIGLVALGPLLQKQSLPGAPLRSFLLLPAEPPPIPLRPSQRESSNQTASVRPWLPAAPRFIPRRTASAVDMPPAPDLGIGSAGNLLGLAGSLPGWMDSTNGGTRLPPPLTAIPKPKQPDQATNHPIRAGSGVAAAMLVKKIEPVYPPLAKSARVQGLVEFTAMIGKDGNIENLRLIRGHPLLVNAARDAVLQWKYRPTQLNGMPVEVVTEISINFTIMQ